MCTRKGYAASVSQLRWQRLRYISSFSNCNIGTKDSLMSADAIVRCCLRSFSANSKHLERADVGISPYKCVNPRYAAENGDSFQ